MTEQFDITALEKALSKKEIKKKETKPKKEQKQVNNPGSVERSACYICGDNVMLLTSETKTAKFYRCEKCGILKSIEK